MKSVFSGKVCLFIRMYKVLLSVVQQSTHGAVSSSTTPTGLQRASWCEKPSPWIPSAGSSLLLFSSPFFASSGVLSHFLPSLFCCHLHFQQDFQAIPGSCALLLWWQSQVAFAEQLSLWVSEKFTLCPWGSLDYILDHTWWAPMGQSICSFVALGCQVMQGYISCSGSSVCLQVTCKDFIPKKNCPILYSFCGLLSPSLPFPLYISVVALSLAELLINPALIDLPNCTLLFSLPLSLNWSTGQGV